MIPRRFVILDRDGTINQEVGHLSRPEQVSLIPGAAAGLRHMQEHGVGIIVVTNQSVVGRGTIDHSRLEEIHERLRSLLEEQGVFLDGIYACTHSPEDDCGCRKPKTALVDKAARDFGFRPPECFVIGDKVSDIELGRRIGAVTLLVRTGYGADYPVDGVTPDHVVSGLEEAAAVIESILMADAPEAE